MTKFILFLCFLAILIIISVNLEDNNITSHIMRHWKKYGYAMNFKKNACLLFLDNYDNYDTHVHFVPSDEKHKIPVYIIKLNGIHVYRKLINDIDIDEKKLVDEMYDKLTYYMNYYDTLDDY